MGAGWREQSRLWWLWLQPWCPLQPQVLPGSPGAARRGLLWILDEEVLIPGSGDGTAFERLCSYFATRAPEQEGELGLAWLPSLWHHPLALGIREMLTIKPLTGLFSGLALGCCPCHR